MVVKIRDRQTQVGIEGKYDAGFISERPTFEAEARQLDKVADIYRKREAQEERERKKQEAERTASLEKAIGSTVYDNVRRTGTYNKAGISLAIASLERSDVEKHFGGKAISQEEFLNARDQYGRSRESHISTIRKTRISKDLLAKIDEASQFDMARAFRLEKLSNELPKEKFNQGILKNFGAMTGIDVNKLSDDKDESQRLQKGILAGVMTNGLKVLATKRGIRPNRITGWINRMQQNDLINIAQAASLKKDFAQTVLGENKVTQSLLQAQELQSKQAYYDYQATLNEVNAKVYEDGKVTGKEADMAKRVARLARTQQDLLGADSAALQSQVDAVQADHFDTLVKNVGTDMFFNPNFSPRKADSDINRLVADRTITPAQGAKAKAIYAVPEQVRSGLRRSLSTKLSFAGLKAGTSSAASNEYVAEAGSLLLANNHRWKREIKRLNPSLDENGVSEMVFDYKASAFAASEIILKYYPQHFSRGTLARIISDGATSQDMTLLKKSEEAVLNATDDRIENDKIHNALDYLFRVIANTGQHLRKKTKSNITRPPTKL